MQTKMYIGIQKFKCYIHDKLYIYRAYSIPEPARCPPTVAPACPGSRHPRPVFHPQSTPRPSPPNRSCMHAALQRTRDMFPSLQLYAPFSHAFFLACEQIV